MPAEDENLTPAGAPEPEPDPAQVPWIRLGKMLLRRRFELNPGYRALPLFQKERGINHRMAWDIENAARTNYKPMTLLLIAYAYAVTPDSLEGVLDGTADALEPVVPGPPIGERERAVYEAGDVAVDKRLADLAQEEAEGEDGRSGAGGA